MVARLASHWWIFLIRGILALAVGCAIPFFPGAAIFAIAILFGAYAFVDGIVAIGAAIRMNHAEARWIWLLVEGVLGVVVGAITFFWPLVTIVALAYLIGAWFVVTGVLAIGTALQVRRNLANEIFMILVGFLSVFAGVMIFFTPGWGVFALLWVFGIYAILAGIFFIGLAFRLRGLGRRTGTAAGP